MHESPVYRPHDEAPAHATLRTALATDAWTGLDARAFELVSRGDFVSGRLYLPKSAAAHLPKSAAAHLPKSAAAHLPESAATRPAPLILLTHGTGESAEGASLGFAADWVGHGFAVAVIDLPLHGRRASPKLSARLIQGLRTQSRGEALDLDTHALVEEFARQSTSDLIRTLDALAGLPEIDRDRLALVGVGIGSRVTAYALAHDARPLAGVFAGGIGALEDQAFDPGHHLEQRSSTGACPLLVMTLADDPDVSTAAATAFFESLSEPKSFAAIAADDDGHEALSADASQRIRVFLAEHVLR